MNTEIKSQILPKPIPSHLLQPIDGALTISIPLAGILLWSEGLDNLPFGYVPCDGNIYNGIQTPDLRNYSIPSTPPTVYLMKVG